MSYLIIIIIVAFVLGPVFWIMPSPAAKRQMRLRERAMALGLQVKLCDLPQTRLAKVRKESPIKGVVYRLPRSREKKSATDIYQLVLRNDDVAQTQNEVQQRATATAQLLTQGLDSLPEGVTALEYGPSGLGLYWREKGGVEVVEAMHQQLLDLSTRLESER